MKVLLDIDGVMVTANSWKSPRIEEDGFYEFNLRALNSLKSILNNTGASILLTTSHKSRFTLNKWREVFRSRGIIAPIKKLNTDSFKTTRKNEVLNWVNNNSKENFIIIDDDKSLNSLPFNIKEKLVLTSSGIGLTEELANYAIRILNTNK